MFLEIEKYKGSSAGASEALKLKKTGVGECLISTLFCTPETGGKKENSGVSPWEQGGAGRDLRTRAQKKE